MRVHIVPKSRGGGFALVNLIAQCRDCNWELADDVWLGMRYPDGRPS